MKDSNNRPIPHAHVLLQNSSKGTSTDRSGYYYLSLPKGRHKLSFSSIGYTSQTQEITLSNPRHATVRRAVANRCARVCLGYKYLPSSSRYELIFVPGSIYRLSAKELDVFAPTDALRLLRSVPGVRVVEEDGYGLRPNIGMRGTHALRSTKTVIMEDGILMAPAPYASISSLLLSQRRSYVRRRSTQRQ